MGDLPFEKTEKEVLIKSESEALVGLAPHERTAEQLLEYGIVLIDKPSGPSSHEVSSFVQKILKIDKAGHSGTLDPGVTGVLPVAMGKGTRIVQALLNAGKEYITLMHLHDEVTPRELKEAFKKFKGKIKQFPPQKSAVKRRWRYRSVYYVEVLEVDGKDVLFKIGCEAGTYIRKYVHDMGEYLGVGAHMQELRRSKAGPFNDQELITLQDLSDAYHYHKEGDSTMLKQYIQPLERGVDHLHKVWIHDGAIKPLSHGVNLMVPGIAKLHQGIEPDMMVAVMSQKNQLIALGRAHLSSKKLLEEEKGLGVDIQKVFYFDNETN